MTITIALDAMGGDHGPSVVVPSALRALAIYPQLHLILVGDENTLLSELSQHSAGGSDRLTIHHASEQVAMDESPALALRNKKDSSMRVAINLVKEQTCQACVSAGNTGALMATARFVLKTLPGIDRPAILAVVPTEGDTIVRMLDLGANIDASPEQLFQFAVMGSEVISSIEGIPAPKVGLLNVGVEEIKGTETIKRAAQLLSGNEAINFTGYVEGDDIFTGVVDLVVCDGFVGNITLKASEGLARMIAKEMKHAFTKNYFRKFLAKLVQPILRSIKLSFDPTRYNGATLVGLQGIVVKSHGGAKIDAYVNAIGEAVAEVEQNIPQRIHDKVASLLAEHE